MDLLRSYLDGKPAGVPFWGGDWGRKGQGAEMLRADLEDAKIPYTVEGPDGPLFADFHALRHSYITALGRSGVDLRTAQELAGHSTPNLTARYMHVRLPDLAGGVEKLPGLLTHKSSPKASNPLKATGTQGAGLSPVCTGFVQTGDTGRDGMGRIDKTMSPESVEERDANPDSGKDLGPDGTDRDEMGSRGPSRIRTGDGGFAIRCLTAWLRGPAASC